MVETVLKFGRSHASIADLKLYNRAMRELRYASTIFSEFQGVPKVAIFGSARSAHTSEEYLAAKEFARRIVEQGYMVITGGGDGIMGAAQEGAGAARSFGLNIRLPFEQKANEVISGDPKLINFRYFFTRKLHFVKETHAFVLFPGGFGTHDEAFEALTLMQTGKTSIVPMVFLDKRGGHYWKTWQKFVNDHLLANGLISETDLALFKITDDLDVALNEILHFYRNFHSYRWVRERMVIRVRHRLTEGALAKMNRDFDHLLAADRIIQSEALPEEHSELHLRQYPRIVLTPHRRDFGTLRLLLDAINNAETEEQPEGRQTMEEAQA